MNQDPDESERHSLDEQIAESEATVERLNRELTAAKLRLKNRKRWRADLEAERVLPADAKPPSAKGITKAEVRDLVGATLTEHGKLDREKLYAKVRHRLNEQNVSANGLGLRMKEVLAEDRFFENTDGRFALTKEADEGSAASIVA